MVGRQIDRYRLLEEIGSGGMAVVYKGLDTALDREVAVKVMHPHLAGKADSRKRFSREARAVAKLRHPNILEIYDFSGDAAQESFIVTEYVRGRTLRSFGDEIGCKLPEIAAMLVEQLAEALAHAHGAGVVHRDLKPENVMVRDDGVLKLMDFGIARMVEKDEKMTMTGALVGSPLHMAPELIDGREADARADVFALGTIFYWLVTGQMAFQGKNTTATLRLIVEGHYADPRMLNPACSDDVGEAIRRCLQKDPAERYQNVGELRAALRPVFEELSIERVEPELKAYFADPPGYSEKIRSRLVARLTVLGEQALANRRQAKALSYFNRVLALDDGNAAVLGHLDRMRRSKVLKRRLRRAGIAAACSAGVALSAYGLAQVDFSPELPQEPLVSSDPTPPPRPDPGPPASVFVSADPVPPAKPPADLDAPAPAPTRPQPAAVPVKTASVQPVRPAKEHGKGAPGEARPVKFTWTPGAAILSVDGKQVSDGQKARWEGELPAGDHRVVLTLDKCCQPYDSTLKVEPGEGLLERKLALKPKPALVLVKTDRDDAAVWVDSVSRGLVSNYPSGVPVVVSDNLGTMTRKAIVEVVSQGQRKVEEVVLTAGANAVVQAEFR